ncbi:hypothetical protein [Clostridium massiliamazoniense]|uniref:hypothetical protein n=1 Tax=Clostridium massiliamazoniense TaxID=1347366 RepID=UPI0006D765CE|nr:hypothetical protein [Clostridium massiliamazoniense]
MEEAMKYKEVQEFLELDSGIKISNRAGKAFKIFKGRNLIKNQSIEFYAHNRKEEVCNIMELINSYKLDKELIKELLKMDLFFILLLEGWNKINLQDSMDKINEYVEKQAEYYIKNTLDKPELHKYNIKDFTFNVGENFTMSFENNEIKFAICNQEIAKYDERFTNLFANMVMDGTTSPQSLIADMVMDATNREMQLEIPVGQRVSSEGIYTGIDEFKSLMKDNFLF